MVNFMPQPLYYQEKVPPVPTEKRLGGPRVSLHVLEKNLAPTGHKTQNKLAPIVVWESLIMHKTNGF